MDLLGAFIAGIVVGWFLQYILVPGGRRAGQPSTSAPQREPAKVEPPTPPAVTIEKLTPLPKKPPQAAAGSTEPTPSVPTAALPSVTIESSVISGGAASGVALSNVTTPASSVAAAEPASPPPASAPVTKRASGTGDRLQTITGIGPVYEKKLKAAGVQTFADLSAQTPAKVIEIIAPKNWQNVDATAWIAQAKTLANA